MSPNPTCKSGILRTLAKTGALFSVLGFLSSANAAESTRIWLTHQSNNPYKIVVNWHTPEPSDSTVEFGETSSLGGSVSQADAVTLHHVEIPIRNPSEGTFYKVRSGREVSHLCSFQGYPDGGLRIAVVADTGFAVADWGKAVFLEKPHLLVSAGDHVPALHNGHPVPPGDTTAFLELVGRHPDLFQSTPWMPLLGNHDREVRPRGPNPPDEPVYDVEATAVRDFFALPGREWIWDFEIPAFGVRFVALDMRHLSDQGGTWQTCHPVVRGSVQSDWYRQMMNSSPHPFLVTLYNEKHSTVRGLEGGEWGRMLTQSSLAITGFGYFAEGADAGGTSYYNTSVRGKGAEYRDPNSLVFQNEDNFMLLHLRRHPAQLRAELKNLSGDIIDSKSFAPRQKRDPGGG